MAGEGEWRQQLPDDLKGHEGLTSFDKLSDFATAYIDLGKTKGELEKSKTDLEKSKTDLEGKLEGVLRLPGEKASDEDRATFFNKIGRPEKPEGYEFKKPDLPEEIKYDEDQEKEYRELAHGAGLSKAQATVIYDWYHQNVLKSHQKMLEFSATQRTEAETELKKEWGDKHDENVEVARRTMKAINDKALTGLGEWLEKSGQGNNPLVIKLFHILGKQVMDDKTILGNLGGETEKSAASVLYPDMKTEE